MSTLADRFILLRGKVKQGDFAKKLKINPNTLRSYENGRSSPNQILLERICVQFSVSPEWILLGRGPMYSIEAKPNQLEKAQNTENMQRPTSIQPFLCPHCAQLEAKLERLEEERRGLSAENRQLWQNNSILREKCARLRYPDHSMPGQDEEL